MDREAVLRVAQGILWFYVIWGFIWFGIKALLALHVFAVTVLYRGKLRVLTGAVITSGIILAIAGYLRWTSLP